MKKILIVEDDASIVLGLESTLQLEGYETVSAHTGPDGFRLAKEVKPDLLILDVMLPGMTGFQVCKRLRDDGLLTPVIMLTSRTEENDKVLGLELGADDYVTKPFSLRELLARVRSHLRRQEQTQTAEVRPNDPEILQLGNVTINFKRHEVSKDGKLQELTSREFELLSYFVRHSGELLTRNRLLDEIWGYDVFPSTRTIDNHVLRLRKHIERDPENPLHIKTVHGAGYLFELQPQPG